MVRKFENIQQASRAAVNYIVDLAGSAVKDKGCCTLVLAGGSTPLLTYELLSTTAIAARMPWPQCHFFWGDERWVAPTHPDSNFFKANNLLLSKVPIPPENIHRITTESNNPEVDAAIYEKHLQKFFDLHDSAAEMPVPKFDLILLGMGTDGHTASLFPRSPLLAEKKKWTAAVPAGAGKPPVARITLTPPVLNGARNVLFLVAGSRKREIVDTILSRPRKAKRIYPAALVNPAGNLVWLVAERS